MLRRSRLPESQGPDRQTEAETPARPNKLSANATKFEELLRGRVFQHYFLLVPQFHAVDLVVYAAKRSEIVRGWGLTFIASDFSIRIKTPEDYPDELQAAMRDGSAKAMIPAPAVADSDVGLFPGARPGLVRVLDEKLAVIALSGANAAALRDYFIRAYLAKEQVMEALKEWPDTWEAVEQRRQLRQERLELESELSPGEPERRVVNLVSEYQEDLLKHVSGVRDADAQRLALGQTGEWMMRCPLRFRPAS